MLNGRTARFDLGVTGICGRGWTEGTIDRSVTLDFDDDALWVRPTLRDLPDLPNKMEPANGGWVFHGKNEVPYLPQADVWLTVGHHYLAILTWVDIDAAFTGQSTGPEWILTTSLPFDGGRVGAVAGGNSGYPAVAGKTAGELAQLFLSTPIEKAAEPYMDLDAIARSRKAHG